MSGGSDSQKQTTTSSPPAWAVPYVQDLLKQGQNQYNNYTPQYYPGSTVAGQSSATTGALGDLANFGNSAYNQAVLQGGQQASNTLLGAGDPNSNPVLGAGMQTLPGNLAFLQAVQQRAGADYGINAGPAAGYANNLDPTSTLNRLQNQQSQVNINTPQTSPTSIEGLANTTNPSGAIGGFLNTAPGSSPYIDQLVQRTLGANTRNFNQNVLPQIDNESQISGGYGGSRQGVAEGVATQGLNDANANTSAQLYSGQYNQDLQNQLQAAGLGANISAQGSNTELARTGQAQNYGLNVAQLQSGNQQADLARQLQAAQGAGSLGLGSGQLNLGAQTAGQQFAQNAVQQGLQASDTGLGLLSQGYGYGQEGAARASALAPQLQQLGLTGANVAGQSGSIQDQYQQSLLNDLVNRFNFQQNLPYQQLNQYANIINGTTGNAGTTQVQTGGQTQSGGLAGGLGGATAGAGIAGLMNQGGATGWGIIGLSTLAGLFS